jgi:hypothetical protein
VVTFNTMINVYGEAEMVNWILWHIFKNAKPFITPSFHGGVCHFCEPDLWDTIQHSLPYALFIGFKLKPISSFLPKMESVQVWVPQVSYLS